MIIRTEKDYLKYRGKCKELCEELVESKPTLTLVRGYYFDASWGKQEHWWCKDSSGNIIDPSKKQFPDQNGDYEEFAGVFECANCSRKIFEQEATFYGNYIFCCGQCVHNFVM